MAKDWMHKNLRDLKVTDDKAKDVRNTQVLRGNATKTPAEKETNSTQQYKTGSGKPDGAWGGEPSGA